MSEPNVLILLVGGITHGDLHERFVESLEEFLPRAAIEYRVLTPRSPEEHVRECLILEPQFVVLPDPVSTEDFALVARAIEKNAAVHISFNGNRIRHYVAADGDFFIHTLADFFGKADEAVMALSITDA